MHIRLRSLALAVLCGAAFAVAQQVPSVNVPGHGSVGIGSMTGGTVQLGLTPQEAQALAKATGQELVRQLTSITDRLAQKIAAQQGGAQKQSISIGVVEGFLAVVKGKKVPQDEWSVVFGELTRQYLQLGERIATTPVTSDKIKQLVARADAERKLGELEKADRLLEEAETQAIADAGALKQQARESSRQAASLLASRASLAFTRLERERGAQLLDRAFEQRADDVSSETYWWLIQAGDAWATAGNSTQAMQVLTRAREVANRQVASDPSNSQWQRDLSISHIKIGETQSAQGDLAGALKSYQAGMAIAQKLAASDPSNSQWQRDLSVSHNKIGDTQSAQGDLTGALKSYQAGMAIRQKLAASDPSNSEWQADLAVSAWKIGTLKGSPQSKAEQRAVLMQGLKVLDGLAQRQVLAPTQEGWPEMFRQAIAALQ